MTEKKKHLALVGSATPMPEAVAAPQPETPKGEQVATILALIETGREVVPGEWHSPAAVALFESIEALAEHGPTLNEIETELNLPGLGDAMIEWSMRSS